jgi:urease accessory protein UreF
MGRMNDEPDWDALKAAIASGASDVSAARRAGVPVAALRAKFRTEGWPLPVAARPERPAAPQNFAAVAARLVVEARDALAAGDLAAVERAARAAERLLKTEGLLAQRPAAVADATAEAAARRAAEDRLFDLVDIEIARRCGERPHALPLWRRLNRPDRRPEGDDPGPDWWKSEAG